MLLKSLIAAVFLLCGRLLFAQDSIGFFQIAQHHNSKRVYAASGLQLLGYSGSLVVLNKAWYDAYEKTSFHSFDDSGEWLQVDKAGHLVSAWYLGRVGSDLFRWAGTGKGLYSTAGPASAFLFLGGIELMDGFSSGWGFSWTDFGANAIGSGVAMLQSTFQGSENRIHKIVGGISLKFSSSLSPYAAYRPELLGSSAAERLFKDYNGQTYWLTTNLRSWLNAEGKLPGWLSLALGYGAEGMISGSPGYQYVNGQGNTVNFIRYRQCYLSLDVDLHKIPVRSGLLKTMFRVFSVVKFPFPALEFSNGKIAFHPYFF